MMLRAVAFLAACGMALAGCIQVEIPDTTTRDGGSVDATHSGSASTAPRSASATASHTAAPKPSTKPTPTASPPAQPGPETAPAYSLPPVPAIDAAALLDDLGTFATRFPNRSGTQATHDGSRQWIADKFAAAGLTVWRHDFTANGLDQQNVIGIRWGLDRSAWVAVSAHFDTTTTLGVDASQSQGAYDDGSGTMLMVHLAQAFGNLTMPYTLAFIAFDGEERGLEGSKALLADLQTEDTPYSGAQIVGDVDIDMFGLNWPGTGAPMVLVTNSQALQDAVEADRLARGVPDSAMLYDQGIALGTSDYSIFFGQGIAAGFLYSDFEQIGGPMGIPVSTPTGGVYPFWHQHDTMETMTLMAGDGEHLRQGFQAAVDLAVHLVHFLARTPGPLQAGTGPI